DGARGLGRPPSGRRTLRPPPRRRAARAERARRVGASDDHRPTRPAGPRVPPPAVTSLIYGDPAAPWTCYFPRRRSALAFSFGGPRRVCGVCATLSAARCRIKAEPPHSYVSNSLRGVLTHRRGASTLVCCAWLSWTSAHCSRILAPSFGRVSRVREGGTAVASLILLILAWCIVA